MGIDVVTKSSSSIENAEHVARQYAADKTVPTLSIVIPIYNEEENIPKLYERLMDELEKIGKTFEVILVNDGSSDASERSLAEIAGKDSRFRIVNLRRNFGQTAAMMAGIDYASGDVIVPMDGDLQNDPADIKRLLDRLAG